MQNKRTVKQVQANGTFDSKNGLLYRFEYEFSDGTTISANHKTQRCPFNAGDDVLVTVRGQKDDFVWGAVQQYKEFDNSKPNSKSDEIKHIESSWAVNTAVLSLGAVKVADQTYLDRVEILAKSLLQVRDRIVKDGYYEELGVQPEKWTKEQMNTAEAHADASHTENIPMPTDGDLPF